MIVFMTIDTSKKAISFRNFISDYPFSFTRRTGKKDEFSHCKRMFVYQLKLAGNSFPNIQTKFQVTFGKLAPCR
jgi:hypothetical protein